LFLQIYAAGFSASRNDFALIEFKRLTDRDLDGDHHGCRKAMSFKLPPRALKDDLGLAPKLVLE